MVFVSRPYVAGKREVLGVGRIRAKRASVRNGTLKYGRPYRIDSGVQLGQTSVNLDRCSRQLGDFSP